MRGKAGWILFALFVLLMGVVSFIQEKSFLSEAESTKERWANLSVAHFVMGVTGNLALIFLATSVILYTKLRGVERLLAAVRQEVEQLRQQPR